MRADTFDEIRSTKVPVAIFIHSRPHETSLVKEAVARYQPEKLYVIADGPKRGDQVEAELCAQAREVFSELEWDCALQTRFRNENMGSGASVKEGLDWVFSIEERLIILEDDTVPEPRFFDLSERFLEEYANDPRVAMT